MIHTMNKQGKFNGLVQIIQPLEQGMADMINAQDGLYTLVLRGVENGQIVDYKGTYAQFRAARERGVFGTSAPAPVQTEPVQVKAEKKEKPKRPGGTKNLEKELNANERAVAKAEERMAELDQSIQESAADYVKLQELYEQKEALEMELLELYEAWERISAQLEEARG
jgi:predicted RNase H-like nuclease (RuvC/YqgF family)